MGGKSIGFPPFLTPDSSNEEIGVGKWAAGWCERGFPRFDGGCNLAIGPGFIDWLSSYSHRSYLFRFIDSV